MQIRLVIKQWLLTREFSECEYSSVLGHSCEYSHQPKITSCCLFCDQREANLASIERIWRIRRVWQIWRGQIHKIYIKYIFLVHKMTYLKSQPNLPNSRDARSCVLPNLSTSQKVYFEKFAKLANVVRVAIAYQQYKVTKLKPWVTNPCLRKFEEHFLKKKPRPCKNWLWNEVVI